MAGNYNFKPGQSGNPRGRPKEKILPEIIKLLESKECSYTYKDIALTLIEMALKRRDFKALQELLNRIDLKPIQRLDVEGSVEHNNKNIFVAYFDNPEEYKKAKLQYEAIDATDIDYPSLPEKPKSQKKDSS